MAQNTTPSKAIIMVSPRAVTLPDSRDMRDWEGLASAIEKTGGKVERMEDSFDKGSYLETWTRDTAFILNGKAYMADPGLVGPDIREDQKQMEPVLRAQGLEPVYVQGAYFEGGDIIVDPHSDQIFMGTDAGNKHSARALETAIQNTQDQEWSLVQIPTEGPDGNFYHLDTFMGILPNGEVITYPEGATDGGSALREHIDPSRIIEVSEEQALAMSTNFIEVNDKIIATNDDLELRQTLQGRGYDVIMPMDVGADSFQVGRGGVRCLTNENIQTLETKAEPEPQIAPQPAPTIAPAANIMNMQPGLQGPKPY